jgi:hypothetical protein
MAHIDVDALARGRDSRQVRRSNRRAHVLTRRVLDGMSIIPSIGMPPVWTNRATSHAARATIALTSLRRRGRLPDAGRRIRGAVNGRLGEHDRLVDVPELVVSGAVASEVEQAEIQDVIDVRAPGDVGAPGAEGKAVAERLRHGLLRYPLGDDPFETNPRW